MWFLQTDTLWRMLLGSMLCWGVLLVLRKTGLTRLYSGMLALTSAVVIGSISLPLLGFYLVYLLFTWVLSAILYRVKHGRRPLFVVFCLVSAIPFFYVKAAAHIAALPLPLTLLGFSYNMLKAIDGLFFVYYGEIRIPFVRYAAYLLFFPVFTAGPIIRYRDFMRGMENPTPPSAADWDGLIRRFIRGMFKKMVVVTLLGLVLTRLLELQSAWYISLAILAVSYCTLYFDLAGYSDLAIACGRATGVTVAENFKQPWQAASFTQFWRKWHVTLSDWIREHIFVVLNGKRLKRVQGAIVAFLTMTIMSLWHDVSLPSMLSGGFMGVCLAVENLLGLTTVDKRRMSRPVYLLRCCIVTGLFSVNSLLFILEPAQILVVLHAFLPW